jgi:regulatory protein
MPKVTALREERPGRVRVELDGNAWRTVPVAAVLAAEIRIGTELDRERARLLRRALRRSGALDAAAKGLSHRDRSVAATGELLARRGFTAEEQDDAVRSLVELGYLDDARFATSRAGSLASRGYGDLAIRYELERQGLDRDLIEAAIAGLAPENRRAQALVATLEGPKAARRLASKGFSEDAIEAAVGSLEL